MAEPENAESTVEFDAEDYEEHHKNLNQETPTEFPKSDIKQYFTFDEIPPSKSRERSIEMLTWCTAELQYYTIDVIQQSISPEAFMSIIYSKFIGSLWEHTTHAREEFLKMKLDAVNLKQVFLNSFPESLGNEAYRALEARNVTIAQTTLGELYQLNLNALAKLCNEKKFLAKFERTGKRLRTACDDKYLRFICQKRGHFARNCPDKKRSQALIHALNQVEPVDVSDLESLYSLDDEPSDSVLCTIANSKFSFDDDSETYSLEKECEQLVSQGIIEPTTSPWACEAFYLNKRSEQVRGKLRLVINYQPLNHFLADDKFALPQKKSLFQHLADARILFKFDLKSGFWQLDEQSHAELLSKFCSLVAKYGIMLSEKKMEVRVTTIQFFGIEISNGKYQPQPHVAQELLKFPDKLSLQKIIQQFIGQTEAVKAIKCLAEKMPPLKIPASLEKRILQTDASDECWGAVLLVQDNNNKRHIYRYKSVTFKASEQHYHSTFKEILVVKRGIKKFQFYLIGHDFQVEMHMSSFPRMLQFKRKMLPHAQLLRWSKWFSQWKFIVKHIKGTENIVADFLSPPKAYKLEENYPKDASRVKKHTPRFLSKVFSITSHKEEGSSSNPTPTIPIFDLPEEIVETIGDLTFEKRAKLCYKMFLTILLKNHGLCVKGLSIGLIMWTPKSESLSSESVSESSSDEKSE
ncbi:putative reverse transcriptase domain, viral movement protein [Tanacetum coccineum]